MRKSLRGTQKLQDPSACLERGRKLLADGLHEAEKSHFGSTHSTLHFGDGVPDLVAHVQKVGAKIYSDRFMRGEGLRGTC